MRKKVKTHGKYLGFIRNHECGELPTKTYVSIGRQENRNVIILDQFLLSDTEYYGWKTVREFKGKFLQRDELTLRLETFIEVMRVVSDNVDIYQKIADYENNSNDSKA